MAVDIQMKFSEHLEIRIKACLSKLSAKNYKEASDDLDSLTELAKDFIKEPKLFEVCQLLQNTVGTMLYLIGDDLKPEDEKPTTIDYDITKISTIITEFLKNLPELFKKESISTIIQRISEINAKIWLERNS